LDLPWLVVSVVANGLIANTAPRQLVEQYDTETTTDNTSEAPKQQQTTRQKKLLLALSQSVKSWEEESHDSMHRSHCDSGCT
jgi:hypothetical protein